MHFFVGGSSILGARRMLARRRVSAFFVENRTPQLTLQLYPKVLGFTGQIAGGRLPSSLESNEREAADLSRVWEPPPRCRDARKYDWAAGPGDRGALRDRHIVG